MAGIDARTGRVIGHREHIAQSIERMLKTGKGERVMRHDLGVDFLDDTGKMKPNLSPASVEASAHDALTRYEPRIELDAVTAYFDGDVLGSIRVAYRDKEDRSQHEVTVDYSDYASHSAKD